MRLRTGRKLGRTIYIQLGAAPADEDPCIGMVDTSELAAVVVSSFNRNVVLGVDYGSSEPEVVKAVREGDRIRVVDEALEHARKVNRYYVAAIHQLGSNLITMLRGHMGVSLEDEVSKVRTEITQILNNEPKRSTG